MRMTLAELQQIRPDLAARFAAEVKGSLNGAPKGRKRGDGRKRLEYEHREQATLFQWAALNERRLPELRWLYAIPNGGHRHPAVAAKLRAEGVKAGVLDICLPVARRGYHGLYIEMKWGDNTLTPVQEEWRNALTSFGYLVAVCYGWREAADQLEWYLLHPENRVTSSKR